MKRDYTLEDEGDINAYLGINVTRPTQTSIKLNQPALIQCIIDSLNLKDQRQHDTPADSVLFKDSEGDPRKTDFHYQSLIGQLNYLTSSTHPDIQFATHQCSRFSIDPKHSHEVAAKQIVCYLKCTANEGITMTPNKSKGFECYVDANFAGSFNKLMPLTLHVMLKLNRLCYFICQLPHLMVFKNAKYYYSVYDRSQVHCSVRCFARCYLHFAISNRTPRKRFPSPYKWTPQSFLPRLRRQCRSS